MRIKLQTQPTKNSCGQTSIAMALGIDATEVIKAAGHGNRTKTSDQIRLLREFGAECPDRAAKVDNRRKYTLPVLCLLRIHRPGRRRGHLILYYDGMLYDPWYGRSFRLGALKDEGNYPGYRIDTYIEITKLPQREEALAGGK